MEKKIEKMIENTWYVVLDSAEVPKNQPLGVMRFGLRMVFWRDQDGQVHAQEDRCCHRGAQLSKGTVVEGCIECPFHGWRFDGKGACVLVPSNGRSAPIPNSFRLRNFAVQEKYGWIWLFWSSSELQEDALPNIEYFAELQSPSWKTHTLQDLWPVHYTRAIENQLDVTHLAFTHRRTIGNIKKPIVDGPVFVWKDEQTLCFFPVTQSDDGQIARKASEVKVDEPQGFLEFRFPNIWKLQIAANFYNFAAFVPVDESHSITYVRLYQGFVTWPVLGDWVSAVMGWFNKRVLNEDRPMVLSQLPIQSDIQMDEMLVKGDAPIIEFRKRRHELLVAQQEKREPAPITGRTNGDPAFLALVQKNSISGKK